MTPAYLVLAATLLVSACSAGDAAGPVPAVSGTVIDASTGTPVGGAQVIIGASIATTGTDGRFVLRNVAPGTARLRCAAAGFKAFAAEIDVPAQGIRKDIALAPAVLLGVYDVTATVTGFDSDAWGTDTDMEGAYYTALLTLTEDFVASFANWRYVGPDYQGNILGPVALRVDVPRTGEIVITLSSWLMKGAFLDSGDIAGTWSCCAHISGTFTAIRRQAKE